MKIKIDDKEYKGSKLVDNKLNVVSELFKYINSKDLEIEDFNFEILSKLTNIEEDILEIIDLEQAHKLQLKLTDLKYNDKESLKIYNSINIDGVEYVTTRNYNNYEDIKLNRYQYKKIKEIMKVENNYNYLKYIAASFFVEKTELDKCYKVNEAIENNFDKRMEIFNTEIEFKTILPFLIKVTDVISVHTANSLDALKKLRG